MALEHFGKILAKSEPKDSNLESLYLLHHVKEVLEKFIDWKKKIENINLSTGLGKVLKEKDFQKAVIKALILHDLGKVSYEFQRKVINKSKVNEELKKEFYKNILDEELKDIKKINIGRHEVYSLIWSILFLDNKEEYTPFIRTAILYHHHNDFYLTDIEDGLDIFIYKPESLISYLTFIRNKKDKVLKFLDNLLKEFSQEEIKSILKNLKENFSAKIINLDEIIYCFQEKENLSKIIPLYNPGIVEGEVKSIDEKDYKFILLLGILRRCDYTGSSGVDIEKDGRVLFEVLEKEIPQSYQWQREIVKEIINNPQKHVIVKAPTGSGKTELAFLWGALNKERKFIYTLPLRVALNDIYTNRVLNNYLRNFEEKENFVGLLHSTSFLEELNRSNRWNEDIDIEIKENTSKTFSYPFLLTTADQVFLSSLFYYGFDSLFAIYPYSCFVIDEIQSYTPEMMAIIFKTLQHIDKLGGKILIMTATPPPYLEKVIKEENILSEGEVLNLSKKIEEMAENIKNWKVKRHRIKVNNESLVKIIQKSNKEEYDYKVSETLLEDIKNIKDKNILIIVNNVMKAVKVYEEIVKKNKERKQKIFLLHSRLLEIEKQRRIKELKKKIESEKGIILVATQIVEASVDLDFDFLYTEISPIDSQIQRWGRIYRNRDKDYEGKESNIVVYSGSEDEKDLSLKFSKVIYSSDVLEKTRYVLEKKFSNNEFANKILEYEDELSLLKEVFDNDLLQRYTNNIRQIFEFLNYFKASKKSQAQNIFRRLSGRYVVFLEPMLKAIGLNDDKEKENVIKLAKFIKENLNRLKDITWKEIEGKAFDEKLGKNYKHLIKKWLYYYSVNIPEYYFSRLDVYNKEFKGFYIYDKEIDDKELKELISKGLDAIKEDIEVEEINLKEDFMI
jgi:CRISPR-associated endonuclease/helicase Cas3